MKYHIIAVFVICLVLGTGLASAGTLTISIEPSLDGNGTIKATSIAKAELLGVNVNVTAPATVGTVVSDNTSLFSLSGIAPGDYFIRLNNLSDYLVPTRIDDPTKNISQFVGRTLKVSVIGNLSDPVYRIETFTNGKASLCYDGFPIGWFNAYLILSLKTKPQSFVVNGFYIGVTGPYDIGMIRITDYSPTENTHPSTSTSTNPPFSKWVFSHGYDYGGNDSKCGSCHGNLSTKSTSVSEITVNHGFCFRCHNGKGGAKNGWLWQKDVCPYHPHPAPSEAMMTPKTPEFGALSSIVALLMVLRFVRPKL